GARSVFSCARGPMMSLAPLQRAGSSAQRHPPFFHLQKGVAASARRAWSCISFAIAVASLERGSWSGTVWSSVSSSQRILSLWLDRLSTDRIARQWDNAERPSRPLIVFGKRGNLDLVVAVDCAAERMGLRNGLALAQARDEGAR